MRRVTIVFFLFVLVIAVIVGLGRFLQSQPSVQLTVAASPLAAEWISAAAERFNAGEHFAGTRRARIVVTPVDDVEVWGTSSGWSASAHPDAWIPALSASRTYISSLPLTEDQPSLAKTLLVWGAFESRVNALASDTIPFGWMRVAEAAAQGTWASIAPQSTLNGNLTLAFTHPTGTTSGFAVILSAASAFFNAPTQTSQNFAASDYRAWLAPVLQSVPNFNTLGASPARTIAARGITLGDLALLPESDWVRNLSGRLTDSTDPIQFVYLDYPLVFDFPVVVWTGTTSSSPDVPPDQAQAIMRQFGEFLLSEAEQLAAQSFGLRPNSGIADMTAAPFSTAAPYGVVSAPDISIPIVAPSHTDIQRLITWAEGIIR